MTRLSLLREKMTFLKKWILGSSPRMTGQGVMMTMTRSRIFTFLMVALLGGFVLSTSSYAAGVKQNEKKVSEVSKFMHEYGIKAKTQGNAVLTRQNLLKQKKSEAEKLLTSFEQHRKALFDKCAPTYMDKMKDITNKYAEEVGGTVQDFINADGFWESSWAYTKGGVKTSYYTAKAILSASWSTVGSVTSSVLDFFGFDNSESGIEKLSKWVLGDDDFAFSSQVSRLKELCSISEGNYDSEFKALAEEAEKLSQTYYDADLMEVSGYGDEIYEHCYTLKNGEQSCVLFVVNEEENKIMSIAGASAGCMPLPFKLYEARSCLFCPLFEIIFNTIQKASTKAFETLGKPLSTLVAIGLALWIALMVLQNVSSMTKQDALEFLTNLFKNSFKVMIAYALLSHASIVYDWIIGPLLKAGFEFGASFLSYIKENSDLLKKCSLDSKGATGVLPSYIYSYLLCFIQAVQFELSVSQAIGDSLMCISWHQGMGDISVLAKVMPDFSMMLQGALIYAISFILSIAFAFYLIDATVQLGIFGTLLPFMILCWPFKITNGYFKKGVEIFMNSWFVFVFMGIIVSIVLQLIGQSLTGNKGDLTSVEAAINGNDIKTLKDLLSIGFSGFLVLLACCVFSIKLMQKVEEVAGKFSGGGLNLGIGAKVGGLAAQGATAGAKLAGKAVKGTASGIVNAKLWEETDKDGNPTGRFLSAADGAKALKNKVTGAVGRGFTKGTKAVGRGVAKPFVAISNWINKRNNADGHLPPSE